MRVVLRLATSLALVFVMSVAKAKEPAAATNKTSVPQWDTLVNGNRSFKAGPITFPGWQQRRDSQNPPVTVLSCSDSRVPPELVFHQNLGQLFVVRIAGNVADQFGVASIEYAILHDYTKLLVILAHEKCGAVEAAINPDPPNPPGQTPSLLALVRRIRESFTAPACTIGQTGCWTRRTRESALNTVDNLKSQSAVIKKAIEVDRLPVVVAYYDLNGGVTSWQQINFPTPKK